MKRQLWNCRLFVRILCCGFVLSGTGLLNSAFAAPVVYGNLAGASVDYLNIQENSVSDPSAPLFGAPSIIGDSLDFNPAAFGVLASNGATDQIDSTLEFVIDAKPNKGISSVGFAETGDGILSGLSGESIAKVAANLSVEILEVNVAGVLTPVSVPGGAIALTFAPSDEFKLSVDGSGGFLWSGSLNYSLGPVLTANSIAGVVTKVKVSLENLLSVSSETGNSAFIQKKDADGMVVSVVTMEIPEPTSAVIGLFLSAGVLLVRKR